LQSNGAPMQKINEVDKACEKKDFHAVAFCRCEKEKMKESVKM